VGVSTPVVSLADLENLLVLVVDDNATNRLILEEMLTGWSMRPTLAESGERALGLLDHARQSGAPFSLAVIDVHMPGVDGFTLVERIRQRPESAQLPLLMLTSGGRPGDLSRCRQLEVGAYLTKPVTPSDLLEGFATLLHLGSTSERAVPATGNGSCCRALSILLAEDNPINQTLMLARLEQQGHSVVLAKTGKEALRAWEQQPFDLVLMDIQMPEMDGFEATAHIRRKEAETGRHTPIVALTAHAMKGDRERCLESGMDGYLGKPIRIDELYQMLAELAHNGGRVGDFSIRTSAETLLFPPCSPPGILNGAVDVQMPTDLSEILDREEMDRRVGGDYGLLGELLVLFAEESPRLLGEIQVGLAEGDLPTVHRAAHSLKGMIATLGGKPAQEEACRLEQLARAGEAGSAREALPALEQALRRFQAALTSLLMG
jgi:CheY-like chemotaxis protein/HPt (histidine-containing phosphotransfer) domain-containing protein